MPNTPIPRLWRHMSLTALAPVIWGTTYIVTTELLPPDRPLTAVVEALAKANWPIIEGPIGRTGAIGKILSVYVRDPDQNLIEISEILPIRG